MLMATCGTPTNFDTVLSLYGWNGAVFTELACNDDNCGLSSRLEYDLIGGQTYYIRVAGYSGATGTYELALLGPRDEPVNDTWKDAIDIGPGFQAGNTTMADLDSGTEFCGFTNFAPDVWYRYRPQTASPVLVDLCTASYDSPSRGTIRAKTCGSHDALGVDLGVDTVLSWHESCPGNPGNELACGDDVSSCSQLGAIRDSEIVAGIEENQVLYLRLSPYFPGIGDLIRLELTFRPENDDCVNATDIGEGTLLTWLVGATNDGTASCSAAANPDVWYRYTAPESGRLRVTTCGTNDLGGVDVGLDTVISLHSGCPGSVGNTIACNDDTDVCSGAGQLYDSSVEMVIAEGQSVLIRVSTYDARTDAEYFLHVDLQPNGAKLPR